MEKAFHSSCGMCHGGCGVLVYQKNGQITHIKGDPKSPLNQGWMCPKGMASLQHLYHPDRLKYPLMRKGERGGNSWKRISWDEALDAIANTLQQIIAKYGAESIAIGQGTGRHHFRYTIRFANALGTPNWCEPGTAQCFLPRVTASMLTFGDFIISDHYGEISPRCILVWGHNPIITGPDGEIAYPFRKSLRRGAKLITVDPRFSETASRSDLWLRIRPGTDAALALAMIHVIIEEQLYDSDFVRHWTIGFDQLRERVEKSSPDWAEKITWIPADKIREAARLFATMKPALIEWGVALEQTPNSLQNMRALAILAATSGNIDVPGGNVFGMHGLRPLPIGYDWLSPEMRHKRMGAEKYKLLASQDSFLPSAHVPTLFHAIRTGLPYPVKAFLIFGNNGLLTYANTKEVYQTLLNLEFLVVTDLYMTPLAEFADIVLPAATWLEMDAVRGYPIRADNVVLCQQKITEIGETKQDEEIMIELARRLRLRNGTESLQELLNDQLQPLGITFDELKEKGHVSIPMAYRKYERSGFNTPSRKVELYSSTLERLGYDPIPYFSEPPESPISTPAIAKNYPLILITGARSPFFFHSEGRQIPILRKKHPDPIVEINPETASRLHIQEGDWIFIETPRGKIRQKTRLSQGMDPRVVHVEHGWWFPEKAPPEHGFWESNANVLTNNGPPYDLAMGTYQLRAMLCRVYKDE